MPRAARETRLPVVCVCHRTPDESASPPPPPPPHRTVSTDEQAQDAGRRWQFAIRKMESRSEASNI